MGQREGLQRFDVRYYCRSRNCYYILVLYLVTIVVSKGTQPENIDIGGRRIRMREELETVGD